MTQCIRRLTIGWWNDFVTVQVSGLSVPVWCRKGDAAAFIEYLTETPSSETPVSGTGYNVYYMKRLLQENCPTKEGAIKRWWACLDDFTKTLISLQPIAELTLADIENALYDEKRGRAVAETERDRLSEENASLTEQLLQQKMETEHANVKLGAAKAMLQTAYEALGNGGDLFDSIPLSGLRDLRDKIGELLSR